MFRKFIFGKLPVEPYNEVLDRSSTNGRDPQPRPPQPSWLTYATGSDPALQARQARLLASELFVKTRLSPRLAEGQDFDEVSLEELLVDFKRSRPGLGTDFELSQVMGTLLNRFEYHLFDEPGDESESLEMDVLLYSSLAGIDLQRVDEAVRNRMRIG